MGPRLITTIINVFCKAPLGCNFKGAGGSWLCELVEKNLRNENVFSLDLNTDSESLPMTDAGSEFQTDGNYRIIVI